MIKAVLFDFDGTIFDTNKLIIESWQEVFRTMTGKEGDVDKIKATFGEPLLITMERWFPGESERLVKIYREYQKDIYFKMIEAYPGMPELIKKLKALGYMNAVVTSRLTSSTINTLDKFDLTKYFDVIVTCDDTDKHKPDPEPALVALRKLGISADEAVMIGDSHFDVLCAQNAGVKAVLVGWSEAAAVTLGGGEIDYKPDYIIEKAEDLIEIIK
ncbi:MAG: HAD-IA family hydrolase [Firmicutes bacterium]|nr:HAD-IA family hydrolase [Bacillota bacterium]